MHFISHTGRSRQMRRSCFWDKTVIGNAHSLICGEKSEDDTGGMVAVSQSLSPLRDAARGFWISGQSQSATPAGWLESLILPLSPNSGRGRQGFSGSLEVPTSGLATNPMLWSQDSSKRHLFGGIVRAVVSVIVSAFSTRPVKCSEDSVSSTWFCFLLRPAQQWSTHRTKLESEGLSWLADRVIG